MTRGTTPTITFTLPFSATTITDLNIAFVQMREIVLEKGLSDCTLQNNKIIVTLSEIETLKLQDLMMVDMQIRCAVGNTVMASQIISVSVNRILKDGVL